MSSQCFDVVDGLVSFAKIARDSLVAQSSAIARKQFREKLSADLKNHASFAHKLTKPTTPSPLLPCESLAKLSEQRDSWAKVWCEGEARPELPILPSASLPVPPDIFDEDFQGLNVKAFRYALRHYPAKKSAGPDLWLAPLLHALPDQILFFFVLFLRLCQWRGTWPEWLLVIYLAMLPKPDGGSRCVGKTPYDLPHLGHGSPTRCQNLGR